MAELTWTAAELAAELGVSEWLLRRNLDRVPHLRIGQRVMSPKVAVSRWLEEEPLVLLALERRGVRRDRRRMSAAHDSPSGTIVNSPSQGARGAIESVGEDRGSALVRLGDTMSADAQGRSGAGMPDPLGNGRDGNAFVDKVSGDVVADVMEPHRR